MLLLLTDIEFYVKDHPGLLDEILSKLSLTSEGIIIRIIIK